MKKFVSCFLCTVLAFSCLTAAADKPQLAYSEETVAVLASAATLGDYGDFTEPEVAAITQKIYDGIMNLQSEISLEEFNIPFASGSSPILKKIFSDMIRNYPEIFVVDNRYSYSHYPTTVKTLYLNYRYASTPTEYKQLLALCKREISKITAGIEKNFSELEKVIYIHDYIVSNYEYDLDLYSGTNDYISDMYGFLMHKKGVCQAYALTLIAVMRSIGIECVGAVNDPENHMWNIVRIDGDYYHIDCTQDDPIYSNSATQYGVSDFKGKVSRKYLLLRDDEIRPMEDHTTWYIPFDFKNIKCTSIAYQNSDFRQVATPLYYYNGSWYGSDIYLPSTIRRYDRDFNYKNDVTAYDTNYTGHLGSRAMILVGNSLYYGTLNNIVKYNLNTNISTVVSNTGSAKSFYLYGGGYIGYILDNDYTNESDNKIALTVGDADNDGIVTALDLSAMAKYCVGNKATGFSIYLADVNFDGLVNILDLVTMKKCFATGDEF